MPFEHTIHTDTRQEAIQRAKNYLIEFGFSPSIGPLFNDRCPTCFLGLGSRVFKFDNGGPEDNLREVWINLRPYIRTSLARKTGVELANFSDSFLAENNITTEVALSILDDVAARLL